MKTLISLVYVFAISQTLVASANIPRQFQEFSTTRHQLNATLVQRELGNQVSNATVIFGPADSRYKNSTARWSIYAKPRIQVVVEPGQASDVSTIVCAMSITIQGYGLKAFLGRVLQ